MIRVIFLLCFIFATSCATGEIPADGTGPDSEVDGGTDAGAMLKKSVCDLS